jgi:FtsZ-interacting cell division protein ZipA
MSTVLVIILIVVVVALVLLGLFFLLPRFRETARVKKRERELGQRRKQAVSEHREEAESRERRAEEAERRARIAEQEAQRERAEAQLRQEQAGLHERGMADRELVSEDERKRFAGTSAAPGEAAEGRDRERTRAYEEGRRAADDPSRAEDFEAGRKRGQD